MERNTVKAAARQVLPIVCYPALPDSAEWTEKTYKATLRRFADGHVEVSTSAVRAMEQWQLTERLDAMGGDMPDGLTPVQIEKIASERKQYAAVQKARREMRLEEMTPEARESEAARAALDNRSRAIRRARQQVRFHCRMLECDHLVTLTYRENMEDVERLQRDWKEFCRLVRKERPLWQFVACREKQDRGAYHLHIAVRGRQDINLLRRCWYRALGGAGNEMGENTPGAVNVRGPSKRFGTKTNEWKASKLAGYMTKYLHKAFEELDSMSSKRYWHSRGIEKPETLRVWLSSSSFEDAVKDTHKLLRAEGLRIRSLWASEGYDCIWMTG